MARRAGGAVVMGLVLVGCGAPATGHGAGRVVGGGGSGVSVTVSDDTVTWHNLVDPQVFPTSTGLYLAWQVSPLGRASVHDELSLVNRSTGTVAARRAVDGSVLDVIGAGGSLYMTVTTTSTESLIELDPRTLAVRHRWTLRQTARGEGSAPFSSTTLATTRGRLWVAAGHDLDRFALPQAKELAPVPVAGAQGLGVGSDSAGTVLVVSVDNGGSGGWIERRDPRTGAVLRRSSPIGGVAGPQLGGLVGDDLWISNPTGNMGFVELYDAQTLAPIGPGCDEGVSTPTCIEGTNGIRAVTSDGYLWVTQLGGGPSRNFCGEPGGRVLASLPIGDDAVVVAVATTTFFVWTTGGSGGRDTVTEVPIPTACRTGASSTTR